MPYVTMREMLEAGVHFGHQTNRWNPKMKPFIFGARNGIYIIDLQQTVPLFDRAYEFLRDTVARGGKVLFVGTKRQAQEIIEASATGANQFYVNNRWLGGTLTNYRTLKSSIDRLKSIDKMEQDGTFEKLPKKEVLQLQRERKKLNRNLGGIRDMSKLPSALFVVDTRKEHIAVAEARKLGVPVVALVDTNCDPDLADFVIPGNDDAIRAIRIFVQKAAEACADGDKIHEKDLVTREIEDKEQKRTEPPAGTPRESVSDGTGPKVEVVRAPSASKAAERLSEDQATP
jgi:small subunit ribosomal protein S2